VSSAPARKKAPVLKAALSAPKALTSAGAEPLPVAAPKKKAAPRPRRPASKKKVGRGSEWMTPSEKHKVYLATILIALTLGGVALASGEILRDSEGGWGCRFRDKQGHTWFTVPLSPSFARTAALGDGHLSGGR
jgi:hypothetical protein